MERNEAFSGDDLQRVDRFSFDSLFIREDNGSPISKLLEYWLELKRGQPAAPLADTVQIDTLWRLKLPHKVTIVDCSVEDPKNFQIIHHAHDVQGEAWFYRSRVTGCRIAELPSGLHAGSLQHDYLFSKNNQDPCTLGYHRVTQRIAGISRDYMRLLLPFAGADGNVSTLIAVTRVLQYRDRPDSASRAL